MEILEKGGWQETVHLCHKFRLPSSDQANCSFPVDAEGRLFCWDEMNRSHQEMIYAQVKAEAEAGEMVDLGFSPETYRSYIPRTGRCDCGSEVILEGFTCTCPGCGADYSSSGQPLAPRSQWGEETGETAADILLYDSMTAEQLLEGDQ